MCACVQAATLGNNSADTDSLLVRDLVPVELRLIWIGWAMDVVRSGLVGLVVVSCGTLWLWVGVMAAHRVSQPVMVGLCVKEEHLRW